MNADFLRTSSPGLNVPPTTRTAPATRALQPPPRQRLLNRHQQRQAGDPKEIHDPADKKAAPLRPSRRRDSRRR
jgi:hypothetical protein